MMYDPSLAAEIILACLIASPCEVAYSSRHASGLELGLTGEDRHFFLISQSSTVPPIPYG